jgi:hypothetical protein
MHNQLGRVLFIPCHWDRELQFLLGFDIPVLESFLVGMFLFVLLFSSFNEARLHFISVHVSFLLFLFAWVS